MTPAQSCAPMSCRQVARSCSRRRWTLDERIVAVGLIHDDGHGDCSTRFKKLRIDCGVNLDFSQYSADMDLEKQVRKRALLHMRGCFDQQRNQATSTLVCNMLGTSRAFATAKARKKFAVSGDQRPPTSPNRPRPPAPTSLGWVHSFRWCADLMATPLRLAAPSLAVPSRRKAEPTRQWQPICHDLQMTAIESTEHSEIQIPHEHVRWHPRLPPAMAMALSTANPPQHSCNRASWLVVAKVVETLLGPKCCQPRRGWKGSPVSSRTGGRTPRPTRTSWATRCANPIHLVLKGNDIVVFSANNSTDTSRIRLRRTKTSWSCAIALQVRLGRTVRNQQLALVAA